MQKFLYRVQYTFSDGTTTYEPVCVRAADGDTASAQAEVEGATARFLAVSGVVSRTITLVTVTADA